MIDDSLDETCLHCLPRKYPGQVMAAMISSTSPVVWRIQVFLLAPCVKSAASLKRAFSFLIQFKSPFCLSIGITKLFPIVIKKMFPTVITKLFPTVITKILPIVITKMLPI